MNQLWVSLNMMSIFNEPDSLYLAGKDKHKHDMAVHREHLERSIRSRLTPSREKGNDAL